MTGATRRIRFRTVPGGPIPADGDFLLNPNTGTTYLIEQAQPSPTIDHGHNLVVTRLDQWAVNLKDEGVIPITYANR